MEDQLYFGAMLTPEVEQTLLVSWHATWSSSRIGHHISRLPRSHRWIRRACPSAMPGTVRPIMVLPFRMLCTASGRPRRKSFVD